MATTTGYSRAMSVAALCMAASPASALADAEGRPAIRRVVETASEAGASPVVVVSFDPDGSVTTALDGSPAVLAAPAPPEGGPVGQIVRAFEVALELEPGLSAAFVWPARITWVGWATVASLIEGHANRPEATLVPTFDGERGWPVVLRAVDLPGFRALSTTAMPGDLVQALTASGVPEHLVETTDPGVVHDVSTPRREPAS
jgi:CTP:molybdopterin cytidylyltransferase MocA